jgi:hypothetical protein
VVAQKNTKYPGVSLHAFLTYNYERYMPILHKENVNLLKFSHGEGEGMGSGQVNSLSKISSFCIREAIYVK